MAISLGEKAIATLMQSAITNFKANLSVQVPIIYAYETTTNQNSIIEWWSDPANSLMIRLAYSFAEVNMPQIAIYTEVENEVEPNRYVGSQGGKFYNGVPVLESYFTTAYQCRCVGFNYNFTLWLQALCKWALLEVRHDLEEQYGLMNQRISLSPFIPITDSMKDSIFPYERRVTLTADHVDSWIPIETNTIISAASATIIVSDE
jgi:hypothetical protein